MITLPPLEMLIQFMQDLIIISVKILFLMDSKSLISKITNMWMCFSFIILNQSMISSIYFLWFNLVFCLNPFFIASVIDLLHLPTSFLAGLTSRTDPAQKWSFPSRISSVNVTKSADLVTFTEENLNGKPHFLCRVGDCSGKFSLWFWTYFWSVFPFCTPWKY